MCVTVGVMTALVTRDFDVNVDVCKSLKFAEIRERLQDDEVELARLRQSVPLDSSSKSWFRCGQGAQQIVDSVAERELQAV